MSKNKGISLNHELRGLLEAKLRKSISDEDFLVKTRAISTKASNANQVGTEEVVLLKNIAQNYIAILNQGSKMLR
jgi:hypothetical protein